MGNTIKMDLYRMLTSKTFKINLLIVTIVTLLSKPLLKLVYNLTAKLAENLSENAEGTTSAVEAYPSSVDLSELIASPFGFYILTIFVLMSVIAFAYADIANGFIKNYAGQLANKGYSIISKFVVIVIHNFIFMACALIGGILGEFMTRTVTFDADVPTAVGVFFLKLLLMQALCTILLFFTAGIRQRTMATVFGVFLGSGMLGLAYFGLNMAIAKVFVNSDINVMDYAPDKLLEQGINIATINALVVSAVIKFIFLPLTVKIFNAKDVR